MRDDIEGDLCDERTAKGLERYWALREQDLEILYDSGDKSNYELEDWLRNRMGYSDLLYASDFDTEDQYRDYLLEKIYEERANYGLSIDVVRPCTFRNQPEMYLRYQFSWGGPSDEIRFYFDNSGGYEGAEYWYMDWGTGCYIDITDLPLARWIWEDLREIFYQQIDDAIEEVMNRGCDAYTDCDDEYIPEECKEEEDWW